MTEWVYVFAMLLCGLAGAICFAGRLFADPIMALGFIGMFLSIAVPIILSSLDQRE